MNDLKPSAATCAQAVSAANHGLVLIDTAIADGRQVVDRVEMSIDRLNPRQKAVFCHAQEDYWISLPGDRSGIIQPALLFDGGYDPVPALPGLRDHARDLGTVAISAHRAVAGGVIAAFIACGMVHIPSVEDVALFHSLASNLLAKIPGIEADRQGALVSPRERECLLWSARGKTSFEIATILSLSEHTVNHYLTNATGKLDAANRAHAIVKAIRLGVIPMAEI